jgi:hypothetical protein
MAALQLRLRPLRRGPEAPRYEKSPSGIVQLLSTVYNCLVLGCWCASELGITQDVCRVIWRWDSYSVHLDPALSAGSTGLGPFSSVDLHPTAASVLGVTTMTC